MRPRGFVPALAPPGLAPGCCTTSESTIKSRPLSPHHTQGPSPIQNNLTPPSLGECREYLHHGHTGFPRPPQVLSLVTTSCVS